MNDSYCESPPLPGSKRQVASCPAMAHSSQLEPEHFGLEPLWCPVIISLVYAWQITNKILTFTGICARVARIKPLNHYGFFYQRRRISDSCRPSVFTNHRMSPEDLRQSFSYVANCSALTVAPTSSNTTPSALVRSRSTRLSLSSHCH